MAFIELRPTETLFQYTSIEGFKGITSNKTIWLSDLAHSNDPRDIVLGLSMLDSIVAKVMETDFHDDERFIVKLLYEKARAYMKSRNRLYTACFTPVRDDLNMWREYGGKGSGLSIGFRPRAVNDMHGRIYGVRYVTDDVAKSLEKTVVDIFSPVRVHGMDAYKDPEKQVTIGVAIISLIASIKHESWSYEREMRLTFATGRESEELGIPVSVYPDEEELIYQPPLSRTGPLGEIEYYAQPFGKYNKGSYDPSGAIEEVIIGSKCPMDVPQVEMHLQKEGFRNVRVRLSDCLFR